MAASQTLGVLSGNAEPEARAAYDPNAPVGKPRHCGLCKHFRRFVPTDAASARVQRFGLCGRYPAGTLTEEFAQGAPGADLLARTPTDIGPVLVGDEFACKFFDSGF